jgi:hypothetical protein
MPRVNLPPTQFNRAAFVPKPAEVVGDATNNHSVSNDGQTIVWVKNTGASTRVVTVNFSRTVDGKTVTPQTYSIAAGAEGFLGPYPTSDYGTTLLVDVAHADLHLIAYHFTPA